MTQQTKSGPCLEHCYCPLWVKILAAISIIYLVASIIYIIFTADIGTPFKDSLTEEQLSIKYMSAKKRGGIFGIGTIAGMIVVILIWRKWFNNQ